MNLVISSEDYLEHPLLKNKAVLRREYQESIFINCVGKNCLIVIPTGLGKTILALMLALHRLSKYPDSRIIFLAPTRPLVEQHRESFKNLTTIPENSLKAITGTIPPNKRKDLWSEVKIAFMTPQVLQNDIITSLYFIRDVSLLIFDECHRAVGDYAYCFIAKKYMELAENPQILGLTASPGSTEEKINEIKRNLFIDHIEIRTDSDSDVKPYIQDVEKILIKIKLPEEFLKIKNILVKKLKSIYSWLKKMELLNTKDVNKVSRKDLLTLSGKINSFISTTQDQDKKFMFFQAKKHIANAIRLSYMGELIETQGINALKDYIEKNMEKIKDNTANKSLRELFNDPDIRRIIKLIDAIIQKGIVHPKLEKLKEILEEELKVNPESRILVFCHFRDSVNNIVKFFEEHDLIRVHKFVGQQKRGTDRGLSQKQQIKLLEDFKNGIFNVLVGTSVAEEGLDIAECDLVIFYDVVPSAIRSIQRRGRTGRKRSGKVYMLMAEGTRDEGYFWAEKAREKSMQVSLKSLKSKKNSETPGQSSLTKFLTPKAKEKKENDDEEKRRPVIICDNRETSSPVVRKLSLMDIRLVLKQILVGDYIISDEVCIERKSARDFIDSLKDGRLFNELIDLKRNFHSPILILEGDIFSESSIDKNALYGALTSIILNLGIMIYRTKDVDETAEFLYQLAKKAHSEGRSIPKLRFEKKPLDTSKILEYIIAGIPGINSLRAKSLLREFKTLQDVFNADLIDLVKVENIGKKIAREIYKLSRYKYKEDS